MVAWTAGFGRAFLPHEFQRFERSLDESRARFEEGVEAVRLLLEQENVSFDGQYYKFRNVTIPPPSHAAPPASLLDCCPGDA